MKVWQYATLLSSHGEWYATNGVDPVLDKYDCKSVNRVPYPLTELGQHGWEVYAVTERDADNRYDSSVRVTYYMRRAWDRYCEHCAKAAETMTKLEEIAPG